jgi:hypothetical protein
MHVRGRGSLTRDACSVDRARLESISARLEALTSQLADQEIRLRKLESFRAKTYGAAAVIVAASPVVIALLQR